MRSPKPLISVLLPVHNSGRHLEESLKSLLTQSYRNIEIIAIDDFSSDSSYKILKKFKKKDKRLRVYKNVKRYGIGITLNRLVGRAKGDFIAFMDSEDIAKKDKLKLQYLFLEKNPEVVVVGTQCTFITIGGRKTGKSNFPLENQMIYQNPLHGVSLQFETVLIRRSLLPKDLLKFNTDLKAFIYSDIFMKIMPYGKFANLKESMHYHRNDPSVYLWDLKKNFISLFKLWVKSNQNYSYSAPVRSFFSSLIKPV